MNRRAPLPRTALAAVLVAAAVSVPCAAWWAMGTRSVEREAEQLVRTATEESSRLAERLAERLGGRLAAIVRSEAARPFYQYAFRYPDLTEDCECAGWIESPIARGPVDSFVQVQFQIDPALQLTLPTLPEEESDRADFSGLRQELERRDRLKPLVLPAMRAATAAAPAADAPVTRGEVFTWGGEASLVSSFTWHTLEWDGRTELAALRTVQSADGRRVQGLLVSRDAVHGFLAPEAYPADFRPATAAPDSVVAEAIGLPGADWVVTVDPGPALAAARLRGDEIRREFRRLFLGGTAGAGLAALLVIGLFAQGDRLAHQRAAFAASAAHELRTPLAGLRVYGDLLADDLGDPDATRSYARQISAEAERLGRVVANVLGFTRLERGGTSVRPEPRDPAATVRESVERLRPAVECAGASIELRAEEGLPAVEMDADAVDQIIQNLIDNAERYGRGAEDRTIEVAVERAPGGVQLSVADRGPGVPAGERRRLFRAFERGRDPDAPAGLGLGLALVAGLAAAHRARIAHRDRPGGGSVFSVTFPA